MNTPTNTDKRFAPTIVQIASPGPVQYAVRYQLTDGTYTDMPVASRQAAEQAIRNR